MAVEAQPTTAYNYETFVRGEGSGRTLDFRNGLRAGDEAPDFELPTPDGQKVRLSHLRERCYVLLEFGSIT